MIRAHQADAGPRRARTDCLSWDKEGKKAQEIYEAVMIDDVQNAADEITCRHLQPPLHLHQG